MFEKIKNHKPLFFTILITVIVVIAGMIFFLFFSDRDGDGKITGSILSVTALASTGHGVETDTGFLVQCSQKMSEEDLRASIAVSPDLAYTLDRSAEDQYKLTFNAELAPDSVITFASTQDQHHSWAFQTENVFRVTGTLPVDQGNCVPVNSGIEVSLSFLDVVNFRDCFSIEPATGGSFEQHGKTWVFVPKALQPDTLYTVTIGKNLKSSGGELLGADYTFSFRTEKSEPSDESYLYISGDQVETFTPDTLPVVEVMDSDHFNDTIFKVNVYKFSDTASYLEALKARYTYINEQLGYEQDYFTAAGGLTEVTSFKTKIQKTEPDSWEAGYLLLPSKLTQGDYLVDITAENATAKCGGHLQKYLQIHPYAVYSMSVNGSELVWVNDTASGKPVNGAEVSINGVKGKTASDGTARIDTPDLKSNTFTALTVGSGEGAFVTSLDLAGANDNGKIDEKYYTYLYTDREKYQPTDTVSVWGVILPKDGSSKIPKKAELQLTEDWGADGVLEKTAVTVDDSGAFTGKLSISGLEDTSYAITLTDGENTYCTTYVDVGEYTKPIYAIETGVAKPVYFGWEPIDMTADITFFDGTPAANMPFSVHYDSGGVGTDINVRSNTAGKITQRLKYNDRYSSWHPDYLYYSLSTVSAEDTQSQGEAEVMVMPRDTMVQMDLKEIDGGYSLAVETNKIDLSSVKDEQDVYKDDYANIKGKAVDIPVTLKITEVSYVKTQTGSYYDFINKVSVPKYDYNRVEKQVEVREGKTVNGRFVFDQLKYKNKPDQYYYATVECSDSRGGKIDETVYFYSGWYYRDTDIKYYSFSGGDDTSLALDDTVKIALQENYQPFNGQGRLLYAKVQNGLGDYQTVAAPSFDYTFTKADIPNVRIYGAYFDGKKIYPVSCAELTYDPGAMNLNIDVKTNGEQFAPGDKVQLELTVTDQEKKPVKGAAVCVSVVDEAAFAVAEQNADPLGAIYSKYYYQEVYTYASFVQHDFYGNGGAEEGGEGGTQGFRKNFVDTAAFLTAVTDRNGKATLSYQLPDNLTTWRLTSLAVADGVYAGKNVSDIVTTKPFFISLIVNSVFLAGDDLSASVRGFGTALKSGGNVAFQANLTYPDGTKKSFNASGQTGEYVNFDFGSGPEGNYTLTVAAQSGAGTDGIQKNFRVVKSALEIPVTRVFSLSEGVDVKALRSPVTLAFFDRSSLLYYQCLYNLASGSGERTDIGVSRTVAQQLLKDNYGKALPYYFYGAQTENPEPGTLQDSTGGVRLLAYGDPDTVLTAFMCAAAPEYLNTGDAVFYLHNVIDNKKSEAQDVAAAYLGLAALHEPVLLDVRYLLADCADDFTLQEKLYLIAALAMIGDTDTAQTYYNQYVTPLLKENSPWVYVDSGKTADTDIECTALAALTAIKTGDKNADGLVWYIIGNASHELTTCMEQLFYVKEFKPDENAAAAFRYTVDGNTKTVQLEKDSPYMLNMTTEQLKAAKIQTVGGEVAVAASYTGSVDDVDDPDTQFVKVDKTLTASTGQIKQSGLVKVTITPTFSADAPKGWYEVSDYIPSGLRYVSTADYWNYNWWFGGIEGQKISFYVLNASSDPQDKYYSEKSNVPIVYYIRATLAGDFVVDPAYIKNTDTAAWGKSERKDIKIVE